MQIAGFFLVLSGSLFGISFLVSLRWRLAKAEGGAGPRTALAYGAGLVATALWVTSAIVWVRTWFVRIEDASVLGSNAFRLLDNLGCALWFSARRLRRWSSSGQLPSHFARASCPGGWPG